MKTSPLILSLCAALAGLYGCASPCESVCESYNACAITQRGYDVDCGTYCDREQQLEESAAKTGADTCKKEFDAHIACWETNIDAICDAESATCEASATAWTDCVAKFCAALENANDQACVPQDEGPAEPALTGF